MLFSIVNTVAFINLLTSLCLQETYGHRYHGPDLGGLNFHESHQHFFANSFIRKPDDHLLTKRQTYYYNEQTHYVCYARYLEIFCSYIEQSIIEVDLSCGTRQDTRCFRDERGVLCLALFIRSYNQILYIERSCSTFGSGAAWNTSNPEACSSQCRALLENFKRTAGCCLGYFFNNASDLALFFDYTIWNSCDVSLTACETTVTSNLPTGVQNGLSMSNCTAEEHEMRLYTKYICLRDIGQPFIDALLSDSQILGYIDCSQMFTSFAKDYVNSCQKNSHGSYCRFRDQNTENNSSTIERLVRWRQSCPFSCNKTCRNGIIQAKEDLGCCVNLYSDTVFFSPSSYMYNVWKTCGVESPGFCESTLSLNTGATTYAAEKTTWMMIMTFLLLPVQLMITM